jgi:hypothetical protein
MIINYYLCSKNKAYIFSQKSMHCMFDQFYKKYLKHLINMLQFFRMDLLILIWYFDVDIFAYKFSKTCKTLIFKS